MHIMSPEVASPSSLPSPHEIGQGVPSQPSCASSTQPTPIVSHGIGQGLHSQPSSSKCPMPDGEAMPSQPSSSSAPSSSRKAPTVVASSAASSSRKPPIDVASGNSAGLTEDSHEVHKKPVVITLSLIVAMPFSTSILFSLARTAIRFLYLSSSVSVRACL